MSDGYARHTPVLSGQRVVRALSIDGALISDVSDAITALTNSGEWTEVGDPVDDVVLECSDAVFSWYSDMMVGVVFSFLRALPSGWLALDGSTYAQVDYPELAAVLPDGLKSGGNFTLPDCAETFPYGVADSAGSGVVAGSNSLVLTTGQLPAHTHNYIPPVPAPTIGGAGPPLPSVQAGATIPTTSVGAGDSVDKRPQRFGVVFAVFAGRV